MKLVGLTALALVLAAGALPAAAQDKADDKKEAPAPDDRVKLSRDIRDFIRSR